MSLIPAMLTLGEAQSEDTVVLSWKADPAAIKYRIYICGGSGNSCWTDVSQWSLLAELDTPHFTAARPASPLFVVVSNVYPDQEVIRVGEALYIRPGPRYLTR